MDKSHLPTSRQLSTHNQLVLLLVALTLVRGLIYASLSIPWWMGHDEDFHFAQVRAIVEQWSSDQAAGPGQNWSQEMVATFTMFPLWRWHESSESQVDLVDISPRYSALTRNSVSYYPYAWLGQLTIYQDILFQLFSLRLVSVVINCATVVVAFLTARQIFPDSLPAQIFVPWFLLFNPAFMITTSTIRDGTLAILLASTVYYLLVLQTGSQPIRGRLVLPAVGLTILAFWAKATAYFLILVWGVLLIKYVWKLDRKYWWATGLLAGLFIVVTLFLLPAKFFDVLTRPLHFQIPAEDMSPTRFMISFFWAVFTSFWIVLGHEVYPLPRTWYLALLLFLGLAAAGLILYGWRYYKKGQPLPKDLLLAGLFAGLSIAVWLGANLQQDHLFKSGLARYLFPAIVPMAILIVAGWRELLPGRWETTGLVFLAGAFFLFDTAVWLIYALPWYYPFWP